MSDELDPLQYLWDKVERLHRAESSTPKAPEDLSSAFDQAQAEIQRQVFARMRERFEKEKGYWENLIANKESLLKKLESDLETEKKRGAELSVKIEELEDSRALWVQESLQSLEMQKRSIGIRVEQLERELDLGLKEITHLKTSLEDERMALDRRQQDWSEKEKNFLQDRDKRELEFQELQADLFQKRQKELEEIARLDEKIKQLEQTLADQETRFDSERSRLEALLGEKEEGAEKLRAEFTALEESLKKEKEDRRLAAVERERQTLREEENRKRLVEQAAVKENKIKDLEVRLREILDQRHQIEEALQKRETILEAGEEKLFSRRENWVESVQGQAAGQLALSGKMMEMVGKIEDAVISASAWPVNESRAAQAQANALPGFFTSAKTHLKRVYVFFRYHPKVSAVLAGVLVSVAIFGCVQIYSHHAKVQSYLEQGNVAFMRGELERSLELYRRGYTLSPQSKLTQNAMVMALGALARQKIEAKEFKSALLYGDELAKVELENPEILRMRSELYEKIDKEIKDALEKLHPKPVAEPEEEIIEAPKPLKRRGRQFPLEYEKEIQPEDTQTPYPFLR